MGSFPAKGKNLYHEESDGNAQYGSNYIAGNRRQVEHIVKNEDYEILDQVVGYIGDRKFNKFMPGEPFLEDNQAVQDIGNDITGYIAQVESQVLVFQGQTIEIGKQRAIEGVYDTDDEEKQKFTGEEMVFDFFDDEQRKAPFGAVPSADIV